VPPAGALARKATSDTTATDTGLAMMPIWLAMEDAGHRPFGPDAVLDGHVVDDGQHGVDHVPGAAQHGQPQVVNGARMDTYFGLRRSSFSAPCSSTSSPPEACSVADAATTATMVSITSTGGLPGGSRRHEGQQHEADAAQQAERHAALARAVEQADQDDAS
jgi:hypothetical protein